MSIRIETYTLPAHWASALVNGDRSGLDEVDADELDLWLTDEQPGYCVGCEGDPSFNKNHDARVYALAGDCLEFTFHVIEEATP